MNTDFIIGGSSWWSSEPPPFVGRTMTKLGHRSRLPTMSRRAICILN
jgi:hypothetical protein